MNVELFSSSSPSAHVVAIGPLRLVFSYSTIVAFRQGSGKWCASENIWSTTTARHIVEETGVPMDKRLPYEEFCTALNKVLAHLTYVEVE
jgi:hypothetical protein